MKLVIPGDLFDQYAATLILKDHEVAQKIEQSALVKQPLYNHLKLWQRGGS